MGCNLQHARSPYTRFYSILETTCGTFERPLQADTAKVMSTSMALAKEFKLRNDNRRSRSYFERIEQRATVTWEVSAELIGSGSPTTAPDLSPLYECAFGNYAIGTNSYAIQNDQAFPTVTLTREATPTVQESIFGAWCNGMTLSVSGTDTHKVKFDGGGMGYVFTGYSALDGAVTTQTNIVVDNAQNFEVNSMIRSENDNNGGAGFLVTAVDYGTNTLTLDAAMTDADNAPVYTFVTQGETTAGSPMSGLQGSLTVAGTQVPVTSAELTLSNNMRPIDDEAFQEFPEDFMPGTVDVTGTMSFRAREDLVQIFAQRRDFTTTQAITLVLGSVAGNIATLEMPQVLYDFGQLDIPEADGDIICTVPFRAYGSAPSGNDEVTMVWS